MEIVFVIYRNIYVKFLFFNYICLHYIIIERNGKI